MDRVRQAQCYIGFLSQSSGEVDLLRLEWQNTETIIEALTTLVVRYPNKKITVVWDNARWHRSKKLREHLGEDNVMANVHLVWLPPYAPDHNPIEKVWNEAKAAISNRQRLFFEDTCIGFETFIGSSAFPTGSDLVGEAFVLRELYQIVSKPKILFVTAPSHPPARILACKLGTCR